MKKFAQVLNNKLHWKFEQEDAPAFAENILIVEITDKTPEPQEGWQWDGKKFLAPSTVSQAESLELTRQSVLSAIDQVHADTLQKLVGTPTKEEKETWRLKLETAQAMTHKTPISKEGTAFLAASGMTDQEQADWAAAVLVRSAEYAQAVGLAEKHRYTAREEVKAARDVAAIHAALEKQRAAADAAVREVFDGK
jgi:hypothetical protein